MNISIRDASLSDYDSISKLHRQVNEIHVMNRPDVYKSSQIPLDFDYFNTLVSDDKFKVFVAEGERIVAYTILRVKDAQNLPILVPRRTLYMDDICVDEDFRGQGIGKMVFHKVKDYAKNIGAVSLELDVCAFNEDAVEFYRGLGMTVKSMRMELKIN